MKRLMLLLSLVLAFFILFNGTVRYKPAWSLKRDNTYYYEADITMHKKIITGSDSLFTYNVTHGWLLGANDTLVTEAYYNKGVIVLCPVLTGGSTVRVKIVVQATNAGSTAPNSLTDSHMDDAYWLKVGTGIANCYASTTEDSITTSGRWVPINVQLMGASLFRVMVISKSTHSGNTKVQLPMILKEK